MVLHRTSELTLFNPASGSCWERPWDPNGVLVIQERDQCTTSNGFQQDINIGTRRYNASNIIDQPGGCYQYSSKITDIIWVIHIRPYYHVVHGTWDTLGDRAPAKTSFIWASLKKKVHAMRQWNFQECECEIHRSRRRNSSLNTYMQLPGCLSRF